MVAHPLDMFAAYDSFHQMAISVNNYAVSLLLAVSIFSLSTETAERRDGKYFVQCVNKQIVATTINSQLDLDCLLHQTAYICHK